MQQYWELKSYDISTATQLQKEIQEEPLITQLLAQRGLTNAQAIKNYLHPDLRQLHSSFLMKDMDKAVNRILKAVDHREKILLFGDYDVDGLSSVALLYQFLTTFYPSVRYYLPHRINEGYGLSKAAVEEAEAADISLIITLDCGMSDVEMVDLANAKGIDVLICDHHRPGSQRPAAIAILNPLQKGCQYPFKKLSAGGIAFKLATAIADYKCWSFENTVLPYIDLVVLSIAADFVPLTGENRILAFWGLAKINQRPSIGLYHLIESANIQKRVDINSIVFYLAPVLNAAGRIGHAQTALQLLLSTTEKQAISSGRTLFKLNQYRRKIQMGILDEIDQMAGHQAELFQSNILILYKENWHPGLLGIIAAKMVARYNRPCLVFCKTNNQIVGSVRSVKGVDILTFLQQFKSVFSALGGHAMAAGMRLSSHTFETFKKVAVVAADNQLKPRTEKPVQRVDVVLQQASIDQQLWQKIQQFAPFGPGNKRPVFVLKNLQKLVGCRRFGKGHIAFKLPNKNRLIAAIAFNKADNWPALTKNPSVDLCFVLENRCYKGTSELSMTIKDMYFPESYN